MLHLDDFLYAEGELEWESFHNKVKSINRISPNGIFSETCSLLKKGFNIQRMYSNIKGKVLSDIERESVEWIESMYKIIFLDIDI